MDSSTLLHLIIKTALEAGKEILEVYHENDTEVDIKSDDSPLTQADLRAHQVIVNALQETNIPVLSEEGAAMDVTERTAYHQLWIVDPLDGTKEFINRNGEFTVNIALIEDQLPIMGVVYAPVTKELFFASAASGAFKTAVDVTATYDLNAIMNAAQQLPLQNLNRTGYKVVASRSHLTTETEEYIKSLTAQFGDVETVSRGSSLKLCLVASGEANCYPRFAPTMEWDTAAGHAICRYSGAEVINWETKKEMRYNKTDLLNSWFLVQEPQKD